MISKYVKEQKRYTQDELRKIFECTADETVQIIRKLKEYGIVKNVKKSDRQSMLSDLVEEDIRVTDIESGERELYYVFSFVGVIVVYGRVLKCYPKYINSCGSPIAQMKQIMRVLEKYNSKEQVIKLYNESDDGGSFNLLAVMLYLLQDYYDNGIYANDVEIVETNGTGEILWDRTINETFSYIGNQNNPPDIILRNGDAIEVKKIQSNSSSLALNSSYPKNKLYSSSTMLTENCRTCEDWTIKDLLYIVGNTDDTSLKELWFVYGDCYAADKEIYERIKNTITSGLYAIPDIELAETNELGKIKKVDPLGITDLRIRGMWSIFHPKKVFDYLPKQTINSEFKFYCIMKQEKFEDFPNEDKEALLSLVDNNQFFISNLSIKSPNNPAELISIKFMEFYYG